MLTPAQKCYYIALKGKIDPLGSQPSVEQVTEGGLLASNYGMNLVDFYLNAVS